MTKNRDHPDSPIESGKYAKPARDSAQAAERSTPKGELRRRAPRDESTRREAGRIAKVADEVGLVVIPSIARSCSSP